MARLTILQHPDPRLRQRAHPVASFDDDLKGLVTDLADTLHATSGIGLSAPQVGDGRAVLVMDLTEERREVEVYVNPVLLSRGAPGLVEESCLSIPGIEGNVIRDTEVEVEARDVNGQLFRRRLSGMSAVCLQHEMDHLEGILFIDRLSLLHRLRVRATLWRRRRAAAPPAGVP
jgi:peptide deformylase